jgi:hypothetical protein
VNAPGSRLVDIHHERKRLGVRHLGRFFTAEPGKYACVRPWHAWHGSVGLLERGAHRPCEHIMGCWLPRLLFAVVGLVALARSVTSASAAVPTPIGEHAPRAPALPITETATALESAACGVGRITKRKSLTVSMGRVIASRPKPGSKHPAGTKVALTVSRGKH